MFINIIICIVAVVLILRGAFLLLKMKLLWVIYSKIIEAYGKKTHGEVVDIEIQVKSAGTNTTEVYIPKIEYKLEREDEKHCEFCSPTLEMEGQNHIHFYPKHYHIGDKVTILYDMNKTNDMFVLPRRHILKLFCTHFILGCFFILSAILGLCFVF